MSVWQPGPRPRWVQSLHAVADPAWIRLDADEILEEAAVRTGLSDFGGDDFLEPYRIFVRDCDEAAHLHPVGRMLCRADLRLWLENRLLLTDTRKRHPEIGDEQLEKPLFITGLPRTGTSILHELLAEDPSARAPRDWEVRHPCPPPETVSYETDARIARADRELELWNQVVPEYATMHELGGAIPVECIQITAASFRSDELLGRAQAPRYGAWLATADLGPAYRFHRAFLQHLQVRCPGRWVLKAPSHLAALPTLFAVYPDARVVWTHRDPLKVIPSVASILYSTAWVRSDAVSAEAVLSWFGGETCAAQLDLGLAFRDSGRVDPARFCDVRYADLMRDPFATLSRVYDHFGLSLGAEAERRMRDYLAAKPRGRHGAHRYEFADTGLDPARERERFRSYQERFGVPSES
jgi:hypothetical protein